MKRLFSRDKSGDAETARQRRVLQLRARLHAATAPGEEVRLRAALARVRGEATVEA